MMGFKVNASFLRFLTMGAVGVRATIEHLQDVGFEPLELERYCGSNKIWMTKVKRLRLPDLLCAKTGLRMEVRAKSDLRIRMSDAPNNPDRRWDVGLRGNDLVAFVACDSSSHAKGVLGPPVWFAVEDLRASIARTKLGPPKSASEGAERDREWKSTVPKKSGVVEEVTLGKIVTRLEGDRRQTYQLRGNQAYVSVGDSFIGGASIIAGAVPRVADLHRMVGASWDPRATLKAPDPVDRYAAAKALPLGARAGTEDRNLLLSAINNESEERVALEMAGSAARLGANEGLTRLVSAAWNDERADLRMEAVLILTEVGDTAAATELKRIALASELEGSELRQAATWGLGKAGCAAYRDLVDLVGDSESLVALHAIAAFGADTPQQVVTSLVDVVMKGGPRQRAGAAEALVVIGSETVVRQLIAAARTGEGARSWVVATLGRMDPRLVRPALAGDSLLEDVEPVLTLGASENWLATAETGEDLRFLLRQNVV
jgi:hypothetical protein